MKRLTNIFKHSKDQQECHGAQNYYKLGGGWGNRIEWDVFGKRVMGWKPTRVQDGDVVLVPMKSGRTGIYRMSNVRYTGDPADMFFADVEVVDYATDDEMQKAEIPQGEGFRFLLT